MKTDHQKLLDDLKGLRLNYLNKNLEDFVSRHISARTGAMKIIEELVRHERHDRAQRSTERRLSEAKIGPFKLMKDFDWDWPKELEHEALRRVLTLDFLTEKTNVILVGPQGLGKSMIAKNIAYQSAMKGYSTLFTGAVPAPSLAGLGEGDLSPEA